MGSGVRGPYPGLANNFEVHCVLQQVAQDKEDRHTDQRTCTPFSRRRIITAVVAETRSLCRDWGSTGLLQYRYG